MSKSKKTSKETRVQATPKRFRVSPLLIVGVVAVAVVTAVTILVMRPDGPEVPFTARVEDESHLSDAELKEETFEVVRTLMRDFPDNAYPIGMMGTVHNNFGQTAMAEEWWQKCLDREPRRADVFNVLAMAALRQGEYQKVADLLQRAQAIDPKLPGVHRSYAEAMMELGRLDEALAAIEREMQISSGDIGCYLLLGKIHFQQNEYEKAVKAYATAAQLQPKDSRSYYGLATACARLGDQNRSREHMQTFSKLRAEEDKILTARRRAGDRAPVAARVLAEALVDAGRLYSEYRQTAKAEESWRRAAVLDPSNTASRFELVGLYRRAQRTADALEVCEELVVINPGNASYQLSTGILRARQKHYDGAEEAILKAIELAPRQVEGYRTLTELLLLRNHKLSDARKLARRLVELAPTARHYSLLSQTCSRTQDRPAALAAMKQAAELAPEDADIQKAYQALRQGQ